MEEKNYNPNKIRNIKISLYDLIVFLYVLAIAVFENATYSQLFSLIQALFVGYTIVFLLFKRTIIFSNIYIWYMTFFMFAFVLALITSPIGEYSTIQIIFKNCVRAFCFTVYLSSDKNRYKKMVAFLAINGVVCALFILKEYFLSDINFSDLRYATSDRIGASIAGGNVNIVALNISFTFTAWIYLYNLAKTKKMKAICALLAVSVASVSLLTGTRKILAYYALVFLLYSIFYKKGKIKNFFIALLGVLVAYYCLMNIEPLYYMVGHKLDFFGGNEYYLMYDKSDNIRAELARGGMKLFFEHPFGVGFGNTSHYLGVYTHNNFIEILACGGIFGFLIYYGIYFHIGRISYRYRKKDDFAFYILVSLLGLCMMEVGQVSYLYASTVLFISMAGTYCSTFHHRKEMYP